MAMKLAEALRRLSSAPASGARPLRLALAVGFTPLHLQTFLAAELSVRTGAAPEVRTGLFDDLIGTVRAIEPGSCDAVAVILEWADLDARLGFRGSHGWRRSRIDDVLRTVDQRLEALAESIDRVARAVPVAIALPTLPLPPRFDGPPHRASAEAFALQVRIAAWAAARASRPGVRVLDPQLVDARSPSASRMRLSSLLDAGFPYALEHAAIMGELVAESVAARPPLKGIITDLDDTLWRGILGDDGVDGISWDLDHKSHGHALYQELLASLAEIGVLVAVVSKNDRALVERAFAREDLVLDPRHVFPIEASWGAKSAAVAAVLKTWNVGQDAVVFVDDSALERDEVGRAFPQMRCLAYPTRDADALFDLLRELRALFGKTTVTDEDAIRTASIRASRARAAVEAATSPEALLQEAQAEIVFELDRPDARSLELVNKTNQWNLNGRRLDEATWNARASSPSSFLVAVTYKDKFGPLGKIAVVMGDRSSSEPLVDVWVMSCRAFSRRIEHATLKLLFERLDAKALRFDFVATERNGPLRELLEPLAERVDERTLRLSRERFTESCPALHARVDVQ